MGTILDAKAGAKPSRADAGLERLIGPGLIVAATGIGAGDVVSATVGGARYGEVLLWGILLGAFFKYVLNEGVARFQLATGLTALEGWAHYLPFWVRAYFGAYLVVWTVAVTAALATACGLGIVNLTGGAIPQTWGAALHSLAGACFVLLGGFSGFEKIMKVLIGTMFFAIIACAALTFEHGTAVARGLLLPRIPAGGGAYVLSLIGGIGGSVTLLSYNYWLREEGMVSPAFARFVRKDLGIAYGFTAIFGISIMTMASRAFHSAGIEITDSQAVTGLAKMLRDIVGPAGFYIYSLGFWAAVFAALLGVWQSVPYLYADFYAIWRKVSAEERTALTQVTSVPYRVALAYVTLAPIPFAFLGRPLFIIVIYTIVGSLFLPFLAATLLWLHRRAIWDERVPRNGWITTGLLYLVLVLFAAIGVKEILEAS